MLHPRRLRPLPRSAQGVLLGLACGLFILFAGTLGWTRPVEHGLSNLLFRLRGSLPPDPSILLVEVDEETVARANQWPLPRRHYAEIILWLHEAGARTIALDVLLTTPSLPEDDAALQTAVQYAGNVVQSMVFRVQSSSALALPPSLMHEAVPPDYFAVSAHDAKTRIADRVALPLPELLESAPLAGHINVHPEFDGTLRRMPHLITFQGQVYPSLALAAATHFLDKQAADVVAGPDGIAIEGHQIPQDENGETLINWVGGNRSFPTYAFHELLDGKVPPEIFKDRIVLIGVTTAGAFEHRSTPFSPVQPAVEFQANALENILQNRPLRTWPGWAQIAIVLGLAAATGGLMAPHRAPGSTLLLFLLSFVVMLGALAALNDNIYIPLAAPLLAAALTYALTVTLNYRQEWESNWRTDTAVEALARGGAVVASGRERARSQEVICEVAREALRARQIFLVESRPEALPNSSSSLAQIAAHVAQSQRLLAWPAPDKSHHLLDKPDHEQSKILENLWQNLAMQSTLDKQSTQSTLSGDLAIISQAQTQALAKTATILAAPIPQSGKILLAIGRTQKGEFTLRDALLLETLAEQAALAFENLEYYERLQGRIAASDRELQEAHHLLVEQSARLITAVENIDSALIVTDAQGKAIFVNACAGEILQDAAPSLDQNVPQVLRSHGLDEIALLYECRETHNRSCEIIVDNADTSDETTDEAGETAERRVLSAQCTPLDESGDLALGTMLIVTDITAQRDLDRMKTDFVSFVAHELRSPLSSIYGYASLLQTSSDRLSADDQTMMTNAIANQCKRLNRMIGELLDISRMEAGRELNLNQQPVDLVELCERVLKDTRAALPPTTLHTLELSSEAKPVKLNADPDRMEQIVTNLVSNAIKYSPGGGTVQITLSHNENTVSLSVSDQGMGMTAEQVARLFQKYYRTPTAKKSGIKGTGLGLFLVKRLITAHGGEITVQSEPNQGTTFFVTLPKTQSTA